MTRYAKEFVGIAKTEIEKAKNIYPPEMWNTDKYAKTGNCTCHPRTLGLLVKSMWMMKDVEAVDVDVRLGQGVRGDSKKKILKPDVAGLRSDGDYLLLVDFESPSSMDDWIPFKDVGAFVRWAGELQHIGSKNVPEYLVVTSLPSKEGWKQHWRWGGKEAPEGMNTYAYWYEYYGQIINKEFRDWRRFPIRFANFDGNHLSLVSSDLRT